MNAVKIGEGTLKSSSNNVLSVTTTTAVDKGDLLVGLFVADGASTDLLYWHRDSVTAGSADAALIFHGPNTAGNLPSLGKRQDFINANADTNALRTVTFVAHAGEDIAAGTVFEITNTGSVFGVPSSSLGARAATFWKVPAASDTLGFYIDKMATAGSSSPNKTPSSGATATRTGTAPRTGTVAFGLIGIEANGLPNDFTLSGRAAEGAFDESTDASDVPSQVNATTGGLVNTNVTLISLWGDGDWQDSSGYNTPVGATDSVQGADIASATFTGTNRHWNAHVISFGQNRGTPTAAVTSALTGSATTASGGFNDIAGVSTSAVTSSLTVTGAVPVIPTPAAIQVQSSAAAPSSVLDQSDQSLVEFIGAVAYKSDTDRTVSVTSTKSFAPRDLVVYAVGADADDQDPITLWDSVHGSSSPARTALSVLNTGTAHTDMKFVIGYQEAISAIPAGSQFSMELGGTSAFNARVLSVYRVASTGGAGWFVDNTSSELSTSTYNQLAARSGGFNLPSVPPSPGRTDGIPQSRSIVFGGVVIECGEYQNDPGPKNLTQIGTTTTSGWTAGGFSDGDPDYHVSTTGTPGTGHVHNISLATDYTQGTWDASLDPSEQYDLYRVEWEGTGRRWNAGIARFAENKVSPQVQVTSYSFVTGAVAVSVSQNYEDVTNNVAGATSSLACASTMVLVGNNTSLTLAYADVDGAASKDWSQIEPTLLVSGTKRSDTEPGLTLATTTESVSPGDLLVYVAAADFDNCDIRFSNSIDGTQSPATQVIKKTWVDGGEDMTLAVYYQVATTSMNVGTEFTFDIIPHAYQGANPEYLGRAFAVYKVSQSTGKGWQVGEHSSKKNVNVAQKTFVFSGAARADLTNYTASGTVVFGAAVLESSSVPGGSTQTVWAGGPTPSLTLSTTGNVSTKNVTLLVDPVYGTEFNNAVNAPYSLDPTAFAYQMTLGAGRNWVAGTAIFHEDTGVTKVLVPDSVAPVVATAALAGPAHWILSVSNNVSAVSSEALNPLARNILEVSTDNTCAVATEALNPQATVFSTTRVVPQLIASGVARNAIETQYETTAYLSAGDMLVYVLAADAGPTTQFHFWDQDRTYLEYAKKVADVFRFPQTTGENYLRQIVAYQQMTSDLPRGSTLTLKLFDNPNQDGAYNYDGRAVAIYKLSQLTGAGWYVDNYKTFTGTGGNTFSTGETAQRSSTAAESRTVVFGSLALEADALPLGFNQDTQYEFPAQPQTALSTTGGDSEDNVTLVTNTTNGVYLGGVGQKDQFSGTWNTYGGMWAATVVAFVENEVNATVTVEGTAANAEAYTFKVLTDINNNVAAATSNAAVPSFGINLLGNLATITSNAVVPVTSKVTTTTAQDCAVSVTSEAAVAGVNLGTPASSSVATYTEVTGAYSSRISENNVVTVTATAAVTGVMISTTAAAAVTSGAAVTVPQLLVDAVSGSTSIAATTATGILSSTADAGVTSSSSVGGVSLHCSALSTSTLNAAVTKPVLSVRFNIAPVAATTTVLARFIFPVPAGADAVASLTTDGVLRRSTTAAVSATSSATGTALLPKTTTALASSTSSAAVASPQLLASAASSAATAGAGTLRVRHFATGVSAAIATPLLRRPSFVTTTTVPADSVVEVAATAGHVLKTIAEYAMASGVTSSVTASNSYTIPLLDRDAAASVTSSVTASNSYTIPLLDKAAAITAQFTAATTGAYTFTFSVLDSNNNVITASSGTATAHTLANTRSAKRLLTVPSRRVLKVGTGLVV